MTTDRIDARLTAEEDDVRGHLLFVPTRPGGCTLLEERILEALRNGRPIFPGIPMGPVLIARR